jgi:hypothetical protein
VRSSVGGRIIGKKEVLRVFSHFVAFPICGGNEPAESAVGAAYFSLAASMSESGYCTIQYISTYLVQSIT